MTLQGQVTNLELSKRLKELGVKQESLFWWNQIKLKLSNGKEKYELSSIAPPEKFGAHTPFKFYSAFTVVELGEMLPPLIRTGKNYQNDWYLCEIHENSPVFKNLPKSSEIIDGKKYDGFRLTSIGDKTEANARAKILIYLLENKIIK